MLKVKRLIDDTLHTGEVSYLIGEARTGVPYPVLEDILDGRYKACVARAPSEGDPGLFYRVYEPTRAMHALATDLFPGYAGRPQRPVTREAAIWGRVRMIHRMVRRSTEGAWERVGALLPEIARQLSGRAGEPVSPLSLAVAAEAYRQTGALHLPNGLAASVIPASLMVMAGVPRERVACLGVYTQDPTVYRTPDTRWRGGFYTPAPDHILFGVYVGGRWVPVDFTRRPLDAGDTLPQRPTSYLRNPDFGTREPDGAPQIADYAHPYTVVFPPPAPDEQTVSPLLKYIPLL